ncbi:caspase-like [Centruroides vittatus]|uniref:caspase-like n=1 Tax=Centruroides vittatus TaxID=120091 RepID=UPI00350E9A35
MIEDSDTTDARTNLGLADHGAHIGAMSTTKDSEVYNMNHSRRGKCIIFNNKKFDAHTKLNERRGTEIDAQKLYHRFRELDFEVTIHHDVPVKEMLKTLEDVGKEDHSDCDCFVCCILTHGDQNVLFGRDGRFATDNIYAPFKGDVCTSLAGKPKLFFIQACQGDRLDHGVLLADSLDTTDGISQVYKIPAHADFLIAYSTIPGFYSWRNTSQGSWFIQALSRVLEEHGRKMDLLSMMTIVNRIVCYDFESCVPNDYSMDKKKQVPCITSMLTRKVYFPEKIK